MADAAIPDNGGMKNPKAIEALRRRIEEERHQASPHRVRFSDELRTDVLAVMAKRGWSRGRVAESLGVARSMLDGWAQRAEQSPKRHEPRARRQRLRRVEIIDTPGDAVASPLVLELPSGAKVHGLTVEHLAHLLEVTS